MRWTTPLLMATSLHAAVIGSAVRWHKAEGSSQASAPLAATAAGSTSPLLVQLMAAAPVAPRASTFTPAPMATPPLPAPGDTDPPHEHEHEPESQQIAQATPAPEPPVQAPANTPADAAPLPQQTSLNTDEPPSASAAEVYHPRSELSIAPRLQGVLDIAFPPQEPKHLRHEATLAIYIDEHGHVRKVTPVQGELPKTFVEAARNAFLSARFQPGQLQGQAVKSFIHVAVVFEETPAELMAASRALPMH